MKSKDKLKQTHIYCPECGMLITVNTILNIANIDLKFIFCSECGKKIDFKNYSIETIDKVQLIYKKNNNDKLNSALELIIYDPEFSQRFKDTYLLFIARMSYVKLKKFEREVNTPISQMELTIELIKRIEAHLTPIITKKPILNILKYLENANYSGFLSELKIYQRKIKKNKKYRKAFFVYLCWIIEIIFKIMSQIDTEEGLFNLEKVIRKDLIQFFGLETSVNIKEKEINNQVFFDEEIIQEDKLQRINDVYEKERTPIEENLFSKMQQNELVLLFDLNTNSYNLIEIKEIENYKNSYIFGLDENFELKKIPIEGIKKKYRDFSLNLTLKHGILSLSKQHKLLSVDENLNIIQITAENVKEGTPILMPRVIDVNEDDSPLDFSNCGEIIVEKGIEYVKNALTKAFRFVEKNFEVGYILGHYCSEGSMKHITFTCGNNKTEMEKVAFLIERNFGYTPYIATHDKADYNTVYSVNSNSILIKSMFSTGLGLKLEKAPFKEIPSFLYNAPIECVKGFIAAYLEGDGSEVVYTREGSPRRDVLVSFYTSSRKLVFGLSFLLKRLGISSYIRKREFDNVEHPSWYNAYHLEIKGKRNLSILRKFIPSIPEIGHFGRDIEPVIDLNPWMKKMNVELKENYAISLRMLSEKGKIPYIAARCAQKNSTMNISEGKLLDTLSFLIKKKYNTPVVEKLWMKFAKNTFTKVKSIEFNNENNNIYDLTVPFYEIFTSGIGQIYIKN